MEDEKKDKIQKFIQDREKLHNSSIPKKPNSTTVFNTENPKVKKLNNVTKEAPTVIKGATTKIDTKEVTRLTPDNFKKVQSNLKAKSAIKSKLNAAIKSGNKDAVKGIIQQVGSVAKKTGNTSFMKDLIKRVSKSKLAKGATKKLLGAIPLVGGIASAISSGDIRAAVPGLDMIDPLGAKEGSLNQRIESGTLSPEEIEKIKASNYTGPK